MASPSPRRKVEVRFCWMLLAAGCCWLLLAAVCCWRWKARFCWLLLAAGCCWLLLAAVCCWLLLQTLVPCYPPTPCPQDPPLLRQGYLTRTAQHKHFIPRPRHSKEWPADSLGAGGA